MDFSMLTTIILFGAGFVLITKGADWFVDAAVKIAEITGIPKIVIGATIVSAATTLPELVVSSMASFTNHPEISIGNAVGSTICNMGLILGICALIKPIEVRRGTFLIKTTLMIGTAFVLFLAAKDTLIDRGEGMVLLLFFPAFLILNLIEAKEEMSRVKPVKNGTQFYLVKDGGKFVIGIIAVIIGGRLLIDNGVEIATVLKIPEEIISLSMVALGTSLPELFTAFSSIRKGQQNISVGNVIGANILDMSMVIGTASLINPLRFNPRIVWFDIPTAIFLMVTVAIFAFTGKKIQRWEGGALLTIYILYLLTLI